LLRKSDQVGGSPPTPPRMLKNQRSGAGFDMVGHHSFGLGVGGDSDSVVADAVSICAGHHVVGFSAGSYHLARI